MQRNNLERIMVKIIERFVVKAPHNGQPSVFGGTVLETLSNGQVVESQLEIIPVEELSEWVPSLNAQLLVENQSLISERSSLQLQIAEITTERDNVLTEKDRLETQLNSANEVVAELQTKASELESATNELATANERVAALEIRIAELTAEPEVPIVSRRQARLALVEMKLFETVEQAVYAGPLEVRIEYEADSWRRDNPTLISMAMSLGLTEEQIDQFFALAGTK